MYVGKISIFFILAAGYAFSGPVITFNDNGAWCWYQDERAIVHDGKLIIGSIADASGTGGATRNGDAEVVSYDIAAGGSPIRFTLHNALGSDDHDLPALIARPDGRILAVYCKHHGDPYIRYRITTSPGDISAWEPEQVETRDSKVTYSNVFRLSAEGGRMYNFYRGENFNPNFIISDDEGQTWSYGGHLVRKDSERPYAKYTSNDVDEIHFVTTEAHPQEYVGTSIYHGYIKNGSVYKSDGTWIRNLSSGPATPEELTQIYQGDANHEAWTVDFHLDQNGYPFTAYSVQYNQDPDDNRYRYARWDGSQWHDYHLAYGGTCLYSGQWFYTGLVALDPQNPDRVYISTDADPYTGDPLISSVDGQRHYELFVGTTTDSGATWTWSPITQNSTVDNLRPIMPIWDSSQSVLLWMRGTYTSYVDYDMDIVGMFDPEPIDPDAPVITNSPDDICAEEGQTIELSVSASSPLSMTYTWYHRNFNDVTSVVGTNSPTLILTNVQSSDLGMYYCQVTNTAGSVVSGEASLLYCDLIADWPLDNSYQDASDRNHDLTPQGNPIFSMSGYNGQAVEFDGDDCLDAGNHSDFDLAFGCTLTAWVKTGALNQPFASIIGKGRYTWRLCRLNTTSQSAFHVDTTTGAFQANGTSVIVDDQWHFVVGTFDGQTVNLYVDGELDVSSPAGGTINVTSDPVWVGGRSDADRYWEGLIDEVRIYNYAMSAEHIGLLYEQDGCLYKPTADFDDDCKVGVSDLAIFMEKWLSCGRYPDSTCWQ